MPQHVLFDNSALNYLFGQCDQAEVPRCIEVRERLVKRVQAGATALLINRALIGEVAGIHFAAKELSQARFAPIATFLFQSCNGLFLGPFLGEDLRARFDAEVRHGGRAPLDQLLMQSKLRKWIRNAFLKEQTSRLRRFSNEANATKAAFTSDELVRRDAVNSELGFRGQRWNDEFPRWKTDPHGVIDAWTQFEMDHWPRAYSLPWDKSRWPEPRNLVTLWTSRAYHAARLWLVENEGMRVDSRGDLYDGAYFQDSAYADAFVTNDKTLLRIATSAKMPEGRFVRVDEWVERMLHD